MSDQVYPHEPPHQVLTGEPAKFADQRLNVQRCAACDNRHNDIEMREYARPPKPFTHWYLCPNLNDPVPVALAMMTNGGAMELRGQVCQGLAAAQVSGRFIVAIFWHGDDTKLNMEFHEEKFPTGLYFETKEQKGVMGMLREQFERNAGTLQQREMQKAALPKPLRDLVGNGQPVDEQKFTIPREVAQSMGLDSRGLNPNPVQAEAAAKE